MADPCVSKEIRINLMPDQIQRSGKTDPYERVISDRDTKLILESTCDMAKSANQIIVESNLAQSTAYRKLKRLVDLNFLQIQHVIGECGRWEMRYKNNLCLFHTETSNNF
ncbi:MAG: hypothetical protein KGI25_09175 [Thaumarchaeota archaeon]|nr:hypothetical protein [Nitrososphaerota archaeon]